MRRHHAANPGKPLRIVEMGPGTGAVTRSIAAAMGEQDRLDCYEINADFAEFLRRAVANDAEYHAVADRIVVHSMAAQEATAGHAVDAVVCSVPLNNLPGPVVTEIFECGIRLLRGNGTFTYFEYPWLLSLRRPMVGAEERRRIDEVGAVKRRMNRHRESATLVLRNLPPARAVHLRFNDEPARIG